MRNAGMQVERLDPPPRHGGRQAADPAVRTARRWEIVWCHGAWRYYRRLPARLRAAVLTALSDPGRASPLRVGGWSVRVGGLRAVVEVDAEQRRVAVCALGPRGQVYRHKGD